MAADREDILKRLEAGSNERGWRGRMFGYAKWLTNGRLSEAAMPDKPRFSVISVARKASATPERAAEALEALRSQDAQIQTLAVRTDGREPSGADICLALAPEAPYYAAFNMSACLASGEILIFIDGAGEPDSGFMGAYARAFKDAVVAARGAVIVPGLTGCQATGSFELSEGTTLWPLDLDENMGMLAKDFFALGGFDESLTGGYGALDLSIRLFGINSDFNAQVYAPDAILALDKENIETLTPYLIERHKSWLELNEAMKRYLELYGKFWRERVYA